MTRLTEGQKARRWREHRGMSRAELAELTGFSADAIKRLELGDARTPEALKRYRMACAAVAAGWEWFQWGTKP